MNKYADEALTTIGVSMIAAAVLTVVGLFFCFMHSGGDSDRLDYHIPEEKGRGIFVERKAVIEEALEKYSSWGVPMYHAEKAWEMHLNINYEKKSFRERYVNWGNWYFATVWGAAGVVSLGAFIILAFGFFEPEIEAKREHKENMRKIQLKEAELRLKRYQDPKYNPINE